MTPTTITPPTHTTRIITWATRQPATWTARQITEGTGLPRADVDAVIDWLVATERVDMVIPPYTGRGRPNANRYQLVEVTS